jgi:hypothetical protein
MMLRRAIICLILLAPAFPVAAAGRTEQPLTFRAIGGLPPEILAPRLLGPEYSAEIVRIERLDPGRPAALQIFLYARPVPLGDRYCSQRRYYRLLVRAGSRRIGPLGDGEPLRVAWGWDETTIARAPGCRLTAGQRFAGIRDNEVDAAMRALDDLASLQEAARVPGPLLPLQLTCDDRVASDPDRCLDRGREALARLPLDGACGVDAIDDDPQVVEVNLCTGGPLWVLRLRASGPAPALSMLWEYAEGTY